MVFGIRKIFYIFTEMIKPHRKELNLMISDYLIKKMGIIYIMPQNYFFYHKETFEKYTPNKRKVSIFLFLYKIRQNH